MHTLAAGIIYFRCMQNKTVTNTNYNFNLNYLLLQNFPVSDKYELFTCSHMQDSLPYEIVSFAVGLGNLFKALCLFHVTILLSWLLH